MKGRVVITVNFDDLESDDRRVLYDDFEDIQDYIPLALSPVGDVEVEVVHVDGCDAWQCVCLECERLRRDAEPKRIPWKEDNL